MEKETSCINSRAILDYLKEHHIDYSSLLKDLDPEIDGLENPEIFLRDTHNWVSCKVISKLYKRARLILRDEKAAYKMGRYATENMSMGYAQRIVFKSFWSVRKTLKNAQKINDKWNKNKKVELVELKRNEAIVRLHWNPETEASKDICLYNQGVYTSLPLVWGGSPAILKEKCCCFDGAPYCEYHIKWPLKNKLYEIFSRFFTSKSVLMDTIKEMEKDKKIIEEKTEKLKNEIEEHKQTVEALRESESKFHTLFALSPQAIALSDFETGRLIDVNEKFCELTKYTKEEIIRLAMIKKAFFAEEDWQRFINKLQASGEVSGLGMDLKVKDGSILNVLVFSKLIQIAGATFILTICVDVTDQKRLEAQLQKAHKMESLGLMAGGIAHDLNNILSGIVSYPDLLLMDLPKDSPLRHPIETIKESGYRAADIVSDLLTVARGIATSREILNLNTVTEEYINSAEQKKLEKMYPNVILKTDFDTELLNIDCSPTHLKKSLMNLVINAYESVEDSGTVTISTINRYLDEPLKGYEDVQKGEYVLLTVSDDGSGISSEDLKRIFDPFYTKKAMGRSGTGLGLTVVWNTVHDLDGYINVKSSGKGTVFDLYFSISRKELLHKNRNIPMEDYMGNGERLLVIDDEKRQREIAFMLLTRLNYSVDAVSSGEEAVEYLKKNSVDLIVLDMIMPKGMNGCETYEQIINIHPKQKAIIISGFSETKDVKAAQRLGAGEYIKKPYSSEQIAMAVIKELGRK
jgi:two-component system, cell cycle sensor histidine kinase and response regulator CckA